MADILGVVFRRFSSGNVTSDVMFPSHVEGNTLLLLGDVNISRPVISSSCNSCHRSGAQSAVFHTDPFSISTGFFEGFNTWIKTIESEECQVCVCEDFGGSS